MLFPLQAVDEIDTICYRVQNGFKSMRQANALDTYRHTRYQCEMVGRPAVGFSSMRTYVPPPTFGGVSNHASSSTSSYPIPSAGQYSLSHSPIAHSVVPSSSGTRYNPPNGSQHGYVYPPANILNHAGGSARSGGDWASNAGSSNLYNQRKATFQEREDSLTLY